MRVRKRFITLGLCLGVCISNMLVKLNNRAIANNSYQYYEPAPVPTLNTSVQNYQQIPHTYQINYRQKYTHIPAKQHIPIEFLEDANSNELNPGDKIDIRVTSDIYIGSQLIFKKNTTGFLIVKSVKPSRNLGKGGYIIFKEGYINDVKGMARLVSFKKKIKGKNCRWAKVISHAMIWNPIGWIIAPKEGEPAYIYRGDYGTCKTKRDFTLLY